MRLLLLVACLMPLALCAQMSWNKDGNSFVSVENGSIVQTTLPGMTKTTLVSADQLAPLGLQPRERAAGAGGRGGRGGGDFAYQLSADQSKVLFLTKPMREYHNTFYILWLLDRKSGAVTQLTKEPVLNAKLSPDASKVAYVYKNDIYSIDLAAGNTVTQLTTGGSDKLLNGWFDYAYSEELYCVDGFRWSPDSKSIAYWQNDLAKVGIFYMINNTDSIYPKIIPIPFSKVGEPIAQARIGVLTVATKATKWMNIEGDPASHYLARMEWTPDGSKIITQQLNRAQNNSKLVLSDPSTGDSKVIYNESDDAWIDLKAFWGHVGGIGWDWIENGKAFLWVSEKDGWRHIYRVGIDGKETLLTKGDFDVTSVNGWDEKKGFVYFGASPTNATQRYLYRASLTKTADPTRVTPDLPGTHSYQLSPNGAWATHNFSSHLYQPATEWISLPDNKPLNPADAIASHLTPTPTAKQTTFFTITTADGITMDAWMIKPANFDSTKKYPVVFYTYSEPVGSTVSDVASPGRANFFSVDDGYIFMSVEGRGAQTPKGRAWRKAVYKNVGWVNVNDQAAACREVLKLSYIDKDRVAVFGSSGGGSTTQNLLFRYPELYKVGLASAGVPNQLIYNTIYEERFMGVLPENRDAYLKCNPLTYAKNLQGHLLIMHGTGDHNVNYQGEEMLLNELIKYNRQFQFMPYPNRTHGITEGEGTIQHKTTLMAQFLKQWCPPGGR
ncbi:MAG: DPP IV N-terminal domain-containing protein [Bacteroidetes bacterium]|nr:DPP IV N-terminal domain-containing protein [Bacteroidota bacterium]